MHADIHFPGDITMPNPRVINTIVAVVVAFAITSGLGAQDTLSAKLDPSGMINISQGGVELAMVELNAHGPNWQHAPQETATAEITDLPDGDGKQAVGTLPIPGTDGGAIEFTETVKTVPQGLNLSYDINMTKAVRINGLQLSIILPVAQYGGEELMVTRPGDDPDIAGLPLEEPERNFQVWNGQGSKVQVASGTDKEFSVELRAAADLVVQDLRQWDRPIFEIRFPAIMQQEGRDVAAEDRFHLDLTITFAAPLKLEGP